MDREHFQLGNIIPKTMTDHPDPKHHVRTASEITCATTRFRLLSITRLSTRVSNLGN